MGGKKSKPEPPPQKSMKELQKEFGRQIRRMKGEFEREVMKKQGENKKIKKDLETMAKKKEPRSTMQIIARGIIRNNGQITKYQRLGAQLSDVNFQLNAAATSETMVNVMKEMNKIMNKTNSEIDIKNVQQQMMEFTMQMEKMNMQSEQLNDIMAVDEEEDADEQVDKIINDVEMVVGGQGSGGMQQQIQPNPMMQQNNQDFDNFAQRLENL